MNQQLVNCPLCDLPTIEDVKIRRSPTGNGSYEVQCPRCGEYGISEYFIIAMDVKAKMIENSYAMSGLARECFEFNKKHPVFWKDGFEEYLAKQDVPEKYDIEAKAKKLLQYLKEKSKYYGDKTRITYIKDYPLAYAINANEFISLIELLEDSSLANLKGKDNVGVSIALSQKGWDVVGKLASQNLESTKAFIAMWVNTEMEETSLIKIQEAIRETGFQPMYIAQENFSETIMDKALKEIKESRFLIVDLTGGRNSVFFEAGFARGLGIDTIYIYRENSDEQLPADFYVKHYKCYKYKDLDKLKEVLIDAIGSRILNK